MTTPAQRQEALRPIIYQRDELLRLFHHKRQHWAFGKARDLHAAIMLICHDGNIACSDFQTIKAAAAPCPPKGLTDA